MRFLLDETVFRKAKDFGAVLLTTDRDFFHTIPHLHDTHCGVIVIALRQPNRAAILSRLEWRFRKLPKRILQTGCSNCGTRPGWPIHQLVADYRFIQRAASVTLSRNANFD